MEKTFFIINQQSPLTIKLKYLTFNIAWVWLFVILLDLLLAFGAHQSKIFFLQMWQLFIAFHIVWLLALGAVILPLIVAQIIPDPSLALSTNITTAALPYYDNSSGTFDLSSSETSPTADPFLSSNDTTSYNWVAPVLMALKRSSSSSSSRTGSGSSGSLSSSSSISSRTGSRSGSNIGSIENMYPFFITACILFFLYYIYFWVRVNQLRKELSNPQMEVQNQEPKAIGIPHQTSVFPSTFQY
jgi:hypothetical protein